MVCGSLERCSTEAPPNADHMDDMLSMSLIATAMHQECTSMTALVACIADKLRFLAGRALIESLGCAGQCRCLVDAIAGTVRTDRVLNQGRRSGKSLVGDL